MLELRRDDRNSLAFNLNCLEMDLFDLSCAAAILRHPSDSGGGKKKQGRKAYG